MEKTFEKGDSDEMRVLKKILVNKGKDMKKLIVILEICLGLLFSR